MEIYLVRHTTPAVATGICYGQSEVLVSESFLTEAEAVLQSIQQEVEIVFTSPLSRCLKLAEHLATSLGIAVIKDDRLKEMNFGEWEMKRWDDINQDMLMKWMNDYEHECCPQGESYVDVVTRVNDFLEELKITSHRSVLIITHAGVIKSMHAILKKYTLKEAMALKFEFGSITGLTY